MNLSVNLLIVFIFTAITSFSAFSSVNIRTDNEFLLAPNQSLTAPLEQDKTQHGKLVSYFQVAGP